MTRDSSSVRVDKLKSGFSTRWGLQHWSRREIRIGEITNDSLELEELLWIYQSLEKLLEISGS
jgi:hypothetical protein